MSGLGVGSLVKKLPEYKADEFHKKPSESFKVKACRVFSEVMSGLTLWWNSWSIFSKATPGQVIKNTFVPENAHGGKESHTARRDFTADKVDKPRTTKPMEKTETPRMKRIKALTAIINNPNATLEAQLRATALLASLKR